MEIKKDRVVTIDYSLSDDFGRIIDSSEENEPLVYLHGNDNIIPGLERELEGKIPGETLSCSIPPTDAYGERNESLVFKVNKKDFGDNGEDGTLIVTVVNVDGEEVTLDANHPLAGETLHFDVKVVDVREATPEELEHGHAHGEYDDECDDDCYCEDDCCD